LLSKTLKITHSAGPDGIDPSLANPAIHIVVPILTDLINSSIAAGIVPDEIKIAKVIPIFKAGEKCKVDNYRPISILPFFSKFFEKIVYERLYN